MRIWPDRVRMKPVIEVNNIWKQYRIGGKRASYESLRDSLVQSVKSLTTFSKKETFWALQGVSFKVEQGECLGIIGHNGAGKSTLLKILSQITPPTKGEIKLRGRVASLLEVGTGFHPELTGRENIYLNGSILGMKQKEIDNKFDEIVDFSGVETFLDTPLKHYSSGMRLRLAFSVAAYLEPEILLIDEVLAVGDAAFQKKCLGKMDEVSKSGRTVLFVSHNLGAVKTLCSRAVILKKGVIKFNGAVAEGIDQYLNAYADSGNASGRILWDGDGPQSEEIHLKEVALYNTKGEVSGYFDEETPVRVIVRYEILQKLPQMRMYFQIKNREQQVVFTTTTQSIEPEEKWPGEYICEAVLPPVFNYGHYNVYFHFGIPGVRVLLSGENYLAFQIDKTTSKNGSVYPEKWPGVILPKINWSLKKISG